MDIPVRCPADTNGDSAPDQGGCRDVTNFSPGTNFMSLYELDPGGRDELNQTVYFPPAPVSLTCDVWGCAPASSAWVAPVFYDSPASPPKVFAEMSALVNWGAFFDTGRACGVSTSALSGVSGASFNGPALAPESIGAVFGEGLAPTSAVADTLPLPTSLASSMVRITDRTGARRFAPLFYVSPTQINFLVPAGTVAGPATMDVFRGDFLRASGTVQVETLAPALFSANSDGRGAASALVVRTKPDGSQSFQLAFECGATAGSCLPAPIDVGPEADRLSLVLFGTGLRGRSSLAAVSVTLAGEAADVFYAGPQNQFAGLDQVNVNLPRSIAGRGDVDVVLTVDGRPANVVSIYLR
jgi:uncharacterized protein (TIGR03437 family)